jgi:hypothetical protein
VSRCEWTVGGERCALPDGHAGDCAVLPATSIPPEWQPRLLVPEALPHPLDGIDAEAEALDRAAREHREIIRPADTAFEREVIATLQRIRRHVARAREAEAAWSMRMRAAVRLLEGSDADE